MQWVPIALIFLAALLVPPFVRWMRLRRWGLPVRVTVDPDDPAPASVAGCLAEIARRLDAHPEPMRVVFDGRNVRNRAIALDIDPDRALRVSVEGRRPHRLDLRGRWIADHPVPLDLRRAVLYIKPVDDNRFRVAAHPPFRLHPAVPIVASALVTSGLVLDLSCCLAGGAGLACGCLCALFRSGE